jgi:hypothetical protein
VAFVLALTGPGGSGKSTIARILAGRLPECVNIEADHVKHFIVSGFRYDEPEGVDQWRLLGANLGMLATNYEAAGYNVIVNGYLTVEAWQALFDRVTPTHRVLLLPVFEMVLARDAARPADDRLGEDELRRFHTFFYDHPIFKDFVAIDSTNLTVEESAAAVEGLLRVS